MFGTFLEFLQFIQRLSQSFMVFCFILLHFYSGFKSISGLFKIVEGKMDVSYFIQQFGVIANLFEFFKNLQSFSRMSSAQQYIRFKKLYIKLDLRLNCSEFF